MIYGQPLAARFQHYRLRKVDLRIHSVTEMFRLDKFNRQTVRLELFVRKETIRRFYCSLLPGGVLPTLLAYHT